MDAEGFDAREEDAVHYLACSQLYLNTTEGPELEAFCNFVKKELWAHILPVEGRPETWEGRHKV